MPGLFVLSSCRSPETSVVVSYPVVTTTVVVSTRTVVTSCIVVVTSGVVTSGVVKTSVVVLGTVVIASVVVAWVVLSVVVSAVVVVSGAMVPVVVVTEGVSGMILVLFLPSTDNFVGLFGGLRVDGRPCLGLAMVIVVVVMASVVVMTSVVPTGSETKPPLYHPRIPYVVYPLPLPSPLAPPAGNWHIQL